MRQREDSPAVKFELNFITSISVDASEIRYVSGQVNPLGIKTYVNPSGSAMFLLPIFKGDVMPTTLQPFHGRDSEEPIPDGLEFRKLYI